MFSRVKDFKGMPFEGANVIKTFANAVKAYNKAYQRFILAKTTYEVIKTASSIAYFCLENLTSDLLGKAM